MREFEKNGEVRVGVLYVDGKPHLNMSDPLELSLRRTAHAKWQESRSLNLPLVYVRCLNGECPNIGFVYQAYDLSSLTEKSNRLEIAPRCLPFFRDRLNGNRPRRYDGSEYEAIVGPCVVCKQHTTQVVDK